MACPLWPLHLLLMYLMALCPVWLLVTGAAHAAKDSLWNVTFSPHKLEKIVEDTDHLVHFWTYQPLGPDFKDGTIEIRVSADHIATVVRTADGATVALPGFEPPDHGKGAAAMVPAEPAAPAPDVIYLNTSSELTTLPLNLSFALRGRFLGYTEVRVRAVPSPSSSASPTALESDPLSVSVIRLPRLVDKVFIFSVAILMALNFINMGCTLNLDVVKSTLLRPIGPFVGVASQYIFMPLISFGLAYAIFTEPSLRLGLFTAGCSPGGGASNMWTYLLDGNLNLSITMTFFSNLFAFATMPLWLFTLGSLIFRESKITIPYLSIVTYVVALVLPVGVGVLMQLYLPRVAAVCRRLLGPFSMAMILFIVVFGIYTNLFMFHLFTWRLFVAGFSVPMLGYLFGAGAARALRFSAPDIIAIAVETGVQNTGIAIVLLRLTLPQPDADLTSVVPVALATMTPIPLLLAMIVVRIRKHLAHGNNKQYILASPSPASSDEEHGVGARNNMGGGPTVVDSLIVNGRSAGTHPDDRTHYQHFFVGQKKTW